MEPFTTLTAIAAPLDIAKVDTGMIVPGRFQRIRRLAGVQDYANVFLHDLRFAPDGAARPDFVLNQPAYSGARILVTGPDFGCGSSRESAAYAVLDYGVRALIGPSFGDVFVGNCMHNGILVSVLPLADIESLWSQLKGSPGAQITVNLLDQTVAAPDGSIHHFDVDSTRKDRLIHGTDDVAVTLRHVREIEAFEQRRLAARPWLPSTCP